jgi:hypothetical protein
MLRVLQCRRRLPRAVAVSCISQSTQRIASLLLNWVQWLVLPRCGICTSTQQRHLPSAAETRRQLLMYMILSVCVYYHLGVHAQQHHLTMHFAPQLLPAPALCVLPRTAARGLVGLAGTLAVHDTHKLKPARPYLILECTVVLCHTPGISVHVVVVWYLCVACSATACGGI